MNMSHHPTMGNARPTTKKMFPFHLPMKNVESYLFSKPLAKRSNPALVNTSIFPQVARHDDRRVGQSCFPLVAKSGTGCTIVGLNSFAIHRVQRYSLRILFVKPLLWGEPQDKIPTLPPTQETTPATDACVALYTRYRQKEHIPININIQDVKTVTARPSVPSFRVPRPIHSPSQSLMPGS